MDKIIRFSIVRGETNKSLHPTVSGAIFDELLNIALEFGLLRARVQQPCKFLPIVTNIDNKGLPVLFSVLAKAGLKPNLTCEKNSAGFRVKIKREYTSSEIDSAPLLYLAPTWGGDILCDFAGRNQERWIAKTDNFGGDSGKGWQQQYGSMGNMLNYFVADTLKNTLSENCLEGLEFHALAWDQPKLAKENFWELSSSLTMPYSKLAIATENNFTFYNDGCFEPVEVIYSRKDVCDMGAFDFALSREKVGYLDDESCGRHLIFLSQNGRKALEKANIQAKYHIVRFDDELENPTPLASLFGS